MFSSLTWPAAIYLYPERAARAPAKDAVGQVGSDGNQGDRDYAEGGAGRAAQRALHVNIDAVGNRPRLESRNEHDGRGQLHTGGDKRNQAAGDEAAGNQRQGNPEKSA